MPQRWSVPWLTSHSASNRGASATAARSHNTTSGAVIERGLPARGECGSPREGKWLPHGMKDEGGCCGGAQSACVHHQICAGQQPASGGFVRADVVESPLLSTSLDLIRPDPGLQDHRGGIEQNVEDVLSL